MSKRFTIVTVALLMSVAFLVGLILAGGLTHAPVVSSAPAAPPSPIRTARLSGAPALPTVVNFADVAERINAAVVNIDATSTTTPNAPPGYFRRAPDEPMDGPAPRDRDAPAQGSPNSSSFRCTT